MSSETQDDMPATCPICSQSWSDEPAAYDRADFSQDHWYSFENHEIFTDDTIYVCPTCNGGFVHPYPEPSELAEFYSGIGQQLGHDENYDPNTTGSLTPRLDINEAKTQRHISSYLLASSFREFHPGDSLLEIGSGYGKGFTVADAIFPDLNWYAIEPDQTAAQALESIGVTVEADVLSREALDGFEPDEFEMISMNSMIDHLRADEVLDALKLVRDSLSEDGIFLCYVTNYLGDDFSRQPPNLTHTTLFNRSSFEMACENVGLSVDFLKTNGVPVDQRDHSRDTSSPLYERVFNSVQPYLPTTINRTVRSLYQRFLSDGAGNSLDLETVLRELNSQDYLLYGGDRRHLVAVCRLGPTSDRNDTR